MLSKKQAKGGRKSSNSNAQLPDINEGFLNACETGDLSIVTKILRNVKDFNIEITDNLGRTALRLATENEHLEIVQVLLSKSDSQKIREILLLAIFLGYTAIVEAILMHPKYKVLNEKKFMNGEDSFWQTPSSDDAQFSPDITPVILAAQFNRTEIVQMLLINGDRISKPHDFNCKCTECLNKFKFDSLRHAQSRLNAYKGLASESYITLGSIDPILTAFELSRELGILAEKEKYFKHEYLKLKKSLSIYSVKLLNNVRGRDELDIVLNKTGAENEEKYDKLARLDLALKYNEKPFVAHSNCQQKIVEIWYTGVRKVSKMRMIVKISLVLVHLITLPFTSMIFLISPDSKIGKFLSLPCVKFISHFASYLVFIFMIIAANLGFASEVNSLVNFAVNGDDDHSNGALFPDWVIANYSAYVRNKLVNHPPFTNFTIRPSSPSALDIIITIWICGHIWHEIKKIFNIGIHDYLVSPFNIINFTLNIFYIASYLLKYETMYTVSRSLAKLNQTRFWLNLLTLNETDQFMQDYYNKSFYWLNSDRLFWVSFDPINLSEGFFALGNVILFARLCFYLPISQQLGPLQITLGKMINDIFKFIFIFLIVFTSFAFSLNKLYLYYDIDKRGKVQLTDRWDLDNDKTSCLTDAEEAFGSLIGAFKTLFFSLYLIADSKVVRIEPFESAVTLTIGYILFAMFHIANVTILMSMLIAMMTKSYENIIHHSDTEWKFARSELYMEYIKEGFTLPVPLNLIPTPISTYNSIKKWRATQKNSDAKKRLESGSNGHIDGQPSIIKRKSNTAHTAYTMRMNQMKNLPNKFMNQTVVEFDNAKNQSNDINTSNKNNNKKEMYDSQKLTYRTVMERVVKRYLMHTQNDTDDDLKLNELEDLKQELQIMKYDIVNDLKKLKEDNIKNANMLNNSLQFVAEEVAVDDEDESSMTSCDSKLSSAATAVSDLSTAAASEILKANNPLIHLPCSNSFDKDDNIRMNNKENESRNNSNNADYIFIKNTDKFIHNSFFDNFIDNFYTEADDHSQASTLSVGNNNSGSSGLSLKRASNRYKVSFDIEEKVTARSNLYKISEVAEASSSYVADK